MNILLKLLFGFYLFLIQDQNFGNFLPLELSFSLVSV